MDNLLKKYLLYEEEKYSFYPKINKKTINYYMNIPYLYKNPNRNLLFSDRNLRSKSYNNIYNFDKIASFNFNTNILNTKMNQKNGAKSTRSYSCKNINLSYLNSLYNDVNNNYRYRPIYQKIENKLYDKSFIDKLTDSYNNKLNLNKTAPSTFYPTISNEKNNNTHIYKKNKLPIKYNNYNNNYPKIKKELKKKNINKNNSARNIFEKKIIHLSDTLNDNSNSNNIISNNEIIHNLNSFNDNNNNISTYNISSIGESIKKNNNKNKKKSPDNKEHLFSFASDLFFIENNNNSNLPKSIINKSLIEQLQKNNNSSFKNIRKKNLKNYKIINRNNNNNNEIKTNNKIISSKSNLNSFSGNNLISTNYSGKNSAYKLNNKMNGDINKDIYKKNNNRKEENIFNHLAVQSINQYNILKDNNENLILQTTIQTLNDS